jgi:3-oxoacyl-[acyl-carrier protein] reductase
MCTRGSLAEQVALVTGAARGIGRACAEGLSRAGAAVVIADRLVQEAEEAARAIQAAGGKAVAVSADVTKLPDIARMVVTATRAFGQVDVLVNNAGILSEMPTEELTEDQWDRLMAVNLKAVVFVTQAVLRGMAHRGRGSVVNISSLAARVGGIVAGVDYAASKAGVIGVTRTLARQYGPHGIRVNAVAPGPIETEMTRYWPADIRKSLVTRIPLGRLGTPEDVARVVVFLAGPEAGYLTGVTIDVNGGLYMG